MKALVYHGPGKRSWDLVPDPIVALPTDAVVRIDSATICGTDLHILKGDVPEVKPGTVLGHEAVGVIEAVGSIPTYRQAFDMVRRGGTLVAYGAAPSTASLDLKPFDIYSKELTIVGSYAGTYETWPEAIALIQGRRFNPEDIVSEVLPLDDVVGAIETVEQNKDVIKIQIRP